MKRRFWLAAMTGVVLLLGAALIGCGDNSGGGGDGDDPVLVTLNAIPGITPPVGGAVPITAVNSAQYTGTVVWDPAAAAFTAGTDYKATITLTALSGYTFKGIQENFFTVTGSLTVTNPAGTGSSLIVEATFKAGSNDTKVTLNAIPGITAPAGGATPVTAVGDNEQYTGTVAWAAGGTSITANFVTGTVYTATITLTAKTGYTFDGVTANFFGVGGIPGVNGSGTGTTITVTIQFPQATAPVAPKGKLTVYNMSSEVVRITATPPGGAAADSFTVDSYASKTQEFPVAVGYSVVAMNTAGNSPAWAGNITTTETKLEFTSVAGAVGTLTRVNSTLPTTAPAGESALTLNIKNDTPASPIIKIRIQEQNTPANEDANYTALAVGSTQVWTNLYTNTKYRITAWRAPTAGGAAPPPLDGYIEVLASPGNVTFDGAGFKKTTGDTSINISDNPL